MGEWLVAPGLCRISRPGHTAHLRPKLVDLLVFLAANQDRVVGKDEILERVWPGEFVVESVLARSVADLRQLLGDSAAGPRFIETVPRRGYRLIAPVQWTEADKRPVESTIAVLPFIDLASGRDQQYFCDGLAEELTNALCAVPGLRVIARTSAFAFRDKAMDIREIGRLLGVDALIEGAVQRADGGLRITVQLVDTTDGCHRWSRRFDRTAGRAFEVQDEIAQAIVAQLESTLLLDRGTTIVRPQTADAEAYDLYLRGRYICARRSGSALAEAGACFEAALRNDPGYALAHASLAECVWIRAFLGYVAPNEFARALDAARTAVQLDPDLPEGHAILATILAFYQWQWTESEHEFGRAIELNPHASLVRMWYSHLLAVTGRPDEALRQAESAQRIDPFSLTVRVTVGLRHSESRRWEPAIEHWRATLSMDPGFELAHLHLGRVFGLLGRLDDALRHLEPIAQASPLALAFLGGLLARLGRRDQALEVLDQLNALSSSRYVGALPFALVHQDLGDMDAALEWYARAFDIPEGLLPLIILDPVTDPARADPRFAALVRRMRLPRPRVTVARSLMRRTKR
jgi:TolB-like protein/Tfp pilus assembly protein PilF